jgi:Xaa-Pro aminopeptidase
MSDIAWSEAMLQKLKRYLAEMELDGLLFVGDSLCDLDMYYLSHFVSISRFAILASSRSITMLVPRMELRRALQESTANEVVSTSEYGINEKLKALGMPNEAYLAVLKEFLRDRGIKRLGIPAKFPVELYLLLHNEFNIAIVDNPILKWRAVKEYCEIEAIRATQRACERAMGLAIKLISNSNPVGDCLCIGDNPLTADQVRNAIETSLLEDGCEATDTIVAGGASSINPHELGHGPLPANAPIVIDISPRSKSTKYFADMTRTVIRGEADLEIREIFDAVLDAQIAGIEIIKADVTGDDVHMKVSEVLAEHGFPERGDRGFMHSTGHGVGLMLHELPILSEREGRLHKSNVVTVEPGLYYPDIGGVRLEDLLVVAADGCENLTNSEKRLVI